MLLASFCWGGAYIASGLALQSVNSSTMILFRWGLAVLFLFIIAVFVEGIKLPPRKSLLPIIGMALFNVVLSNFLMFEAYKTTSATNISFISGLNPIMISIWAMIFLKEKIGLYQIFGGILAFFGVIVVIFNGDFGQLLSLQYTIGDLLMLGAVASHGLYAICSKFALNIFSPINAVMYSGIIGLLMFLPFGYRDISVPQLNTDLIFYLLISGVLGTAFAQYLFVTSIKKIGAATSGIILNFNPLFAVLLSWLFLSKPINSSDILGWLIIVAGVVLFYRR